MSKKLFGKSKAQSTVANESPQQNTAVPNSWVCKKCGATNSNSTLSCKDCGAYK